MAPGTKRRRDEKQFEDGQSITPKKSRISNVIQHQDAEIQLPPAAATPSGHKQSRKAASDTNSTPSKRTPKSALKANGWKQSPSSRGTPRSERRVLFSKPGNSNEDVTPKAKANGTKSDSKSADRSARKKSARRLVEQNMLDEVSDEEDLAQEELLARQIRDESEEEEIIDEDEAGEVVIEADQSAEIAPDTPSKRGRGRPKGSRRKRTPTPPLDLPPHERYFFQNRPSGNKTSNNTLSSALLLDHDEYFAQLRDYKDPHKPDIEFLHGLHSRSFPQWAFELSEKFNLCLHGWGSKRKLALDFVQYLQTNPSTSSKASKMLVINGYNASLTLRDVLQSIASLLPSLKEVKLPAQPAAMLTLIVTHLNSCDPPDPPPVLLVNSIDAPPLRKTVLHSVFASLAATKRLLLILTADTSTFPLLWDHSTLSRLHLVFHDATTYQPFDVEIDAISEVQNLLGRGGRRGLGGRAGVAFVLKSLTENARGLFKILVNEQLTSTSTGVEQFDPGDDTLEPLGRIDGDLLAVTPARRKRTAATLDVGDVGGVEYRTLYHKAVEDFICSSEHAFRTLLKEFHDHQMVESRKDAMGTEILYAPFRKEDLESLLEEIIA
ncbi:MAG: Origin recognition complex subunit 2 [Bogoriella megaspora]|nr:MAG: Origin recognition complex subunit 2 [Bogoriella megaspora]